MLRVLSTLSLVVGFAAQAQDSTELRREDLMAALREGGYTVILRHAHGPVVQ
jgi:hypothetical protein